MSIRVKSTYASLRCPDDGNEEQGICLESTIRFAFVRNASESMRRTFALKVVELDQANMAKFVF